MEFSARQIAGFLDGTIEGGPNVKINNFSKIERGKPGILTFLANLKYTHHIYNTEVNIVLVNSGFKPGQPVGATLARVENAYAALTMLLNLVEQSKNKKKGADSTAFIAASAVVGDDCYVGDFAYIGEGAKMDKNCVVYPHAYIGDHVTVGNNCVFYPHTTVYESYTIGNNCTLHAGSVVGVDGFGFTPGDETYRKIPQLGNVIIENDMGIGASTAVGRAVMDPTIIHRGVKLDNLVQIARNVEVGENTVMAARVGIVGSVKVGKHYMFDGQVGLAGRIRVAGHVVFGTRIGVISDMKEATTLFGTPTINAKNFTCSSTIFNRLPDIYCSLEQMRREIEQLKGEINKQ